MEHYKKLRIPKHIKRIKILSYSQYKWHYYYHGLGKLEIKNIPDNAELHIKWYYKECMCWAYIKYFALRKDWNLYNLD